MKRAYEANKGKVEVIGVGIQDSEANIKKFATELGMPWPVGFDSDGSVAKAFVITFGAGIVHVDSSGVIRAWHGTTFSSKDLEKDISLILPGTHAAPKTP